MSFFHKTPSNTIESKFVPGEDLYKEGKYEEAEEFLQRAVRHAARGPDYDRAKDLLSKTRAKLQNRSTGEPSHQHAAQGTAAQNSDGGTDRKLRPGPTVKTKYQDPSKAAKAPGANPAPSNTIKPKPSLPVPQMNHSIKNLHPEEQLAAGPVNGKSLPLQSQAVEVTLFAADDDKDTWVERQRTDKFKNVFIERLEKHWRDYLITLPEASKDSKYDKNVRIAILDTGIFIDENDSLLSAGKERIVERRNFLHPGEPGCVDTHGHGTHVARILLRFAPRAELLVAKISEGRSLKAIEPLLEALQWAGDNADIVNLSFGSPWEMPTIKPKLRGLIQKHKLVFAAASNSGGNGPRAYPARERNVFAIHATNDRGDKASGMNPAPISTMDNFSTLGVNIDSFWKGKEVSISGTSFATPIAAAMAANAVEFVRRTLTEDDHPDYFMAYGGMRVLFHCMSQEIDGYSYVKPWQDGLWDNRSNVREKLREIAVDQDWPRGR